MFEFVLLEVAVSKNQSTTLVVLQTFHLESSAEESQYVAKDSETYSVVHILFLWATGLQELKVNLRTPPMCDCAFRRPGVGGKPFLGQVHLLLLIF